jgi:hypothetical protein
MTTPTIRPSQGRSITLNYPIGDISLKLALKLMPPEECPALDDNTAIAKGAFYWRIDDKTAIRVKLGADPDADDVND